MNNIQLGGVMVQWLLPSLHGEKVRTCQLTEDFSVWVLSACPSNSGVSYEWSCFLLQTKERGLGQLWMVVGHCVSSLIDLRGVPTSYPRVSRLGLAPAWLLSFPNIQYVLQVQVNECLLQYKVSLLACEFLIRDSLTHNRKIYIHCQ